MVPKASAVLTAGKNLHGARQASPRTGSSSASSRAASRTPGSTPAMRRRWRPGRSGKAPRRGGRRVSALLRPNRRTKAACAEALHDLPGDQDRLRAARVQDHLHRRIADEHPRLFMESASCAALRRGTSTTSRPCSRNWTSRRWPFADLLEEARAEGRKVFFIGNGGSAATSSHFANDLGKGRGSKGRRRSGAQPRRQRLLITALANDEGYDQVFVAQLEPLLRWRVTW